MRAEGRGDFRAGVGFCQLLSIKGTRIMSALLLSGRKCILNRRFLLSASINQAFVCARPMLIPGIPGRTTQPLLSQDTNKETMLDNEAPSAMGILVGCNTQPGLRKFKEGITPRNGEGIIVRLLHSECSLCEPTASLLLMILRRPPVSLPGVNPLYS